MEDNIRIVVSPVVKQDGRQKIFINFMIEISCKFLIFHELGHIYNGHLLKMWDFQMKSLKYLRNIWRKNSQKYWKKQEL